MSALRRSGHPSKGQSPSVNVIPLEQAGITPDPHNARRQAPRNMAVIETDGDTLVIVKRNVTPE
jgi:hypothetical protein